MQVGMSTGIVFKAVWQATAAISLRMSAKFGTMGMEVELGGSHRLTEFSTAGCAVAAGLQVSLPSAVHQSSKHMVMKTVISRAGANGPTEF